MRLIDADTLLKKVEKHIKQRRLIDGGFVTELKSFIILEPTAYDIEQVVKDLEYEVAREILLIDMRKEDFYKYVHECSKEAYKTAIDIVMKGGGSDE